MREVSSKADTYLSYFFKPVQSYSFKSVWLYLKRLQDVYEILV